MEASADLVTCKAITAPEPEVSTTKREVTSYKSMVGDVNRFDRVREFVAPGAFSSWSGLQKAVAAKQIPARHNHKDLVGLIVHVEETSEGLLTTEKYGTNPISDRIYSLIREGILNTSSFQASYKASDRIKHKGPDGQPVWELRNLVLREAGPADPDFAVNPETRVVSVKGLQEVAGALGSLSGLNSAETWTLDYLKTLTPEDKDALASILSMLPHGEAVDAILLALQGEQAESQAEDYTGKAIAKAYELTELYRAARVGGLLDRMLNGLTKCRPSAATL